jgi:hypothetical protein
MLLLCGRVLSAVRGSFRLAHSMGSPLTFCAQLLRAFVFVATSMVERPAMDRKLSLE